MSGGATNLEQTLASLRSDSNVQFAEPDNIVTVNETPNDPYFSSYGSWGQAYDDLWGIKAINSSTAWDTSTGAGMVVAVVDTGLDYNHADITANVWTNPGEIAGNGIDDDKNGYIDDTRGWNFVANTNNPMDDNGHGTHVSGTIAATGENGIGVIGVAFHAQVMPVKAFDSTGASTDSILANAMAYAANNGADVINCSWGGEGTSQTLQEAVDYAYNLGAVIVAAAGNNSADASTFYPAAFWDVITVSALDSNKTLASFSNFGTKVDVAAPGVGILSLRASGTDLGTVVGDDYLVLNGTSMAAPHVSGTAALILAANPGYSNEDVRQAMRVSATDIGDTGFDSLYGYGLVNASGAAKVANVLEAKIQSPSSGESVTGTLSITGVARGTGFASYKLEYGSGQLPGAWTTLQTGTSPVSGTLGSLDCSLLPDGLYSLRLTAYDSGNRAFIDQVNFSVRYVSITSPLQPAVPIVAAVFKPGSPVGIIGTATGGSFQGFQIQWAEGQNPSSGWSSSGITLTGGGATPITQGLLGTWDTSGITQADYFTIRLTVTNSGFTSQTSTLIYLEPDLFSANWPQWLDSAPGTNSGVVPAEDASGNTTLAVMWPLYMNSTVQPRYRSFSPDGSTQSSVLLNDGGLLPPAFGHLYPEDGGESVMADGRSTIREVYANMSNFVFPFSQTVDFFFSPVILSDLEGNSSLDAITVGYQAWLNTAFLYAFRPDGTLLNSNFPVQLQNSGGVSLSPSVVVGDIDGDGKPEIIVEESLTYSTFDFRVFGNDGVARSWNNSVYSGQPGPMILADLDHNGKLEVIFSSPTSYGTPAAIHVLQPDGTERAGWPVSVPYSINNFAVGDLARNGNEQIVASDDIYTLYVLNSDGTPFSSAWPQVSPNWSSLSSPVIADVDGDGYPEILVIRGDEATVSGAAAQRTAPASVTTTSSGVRRVDVENTPGTASSTIYLTPKLLAIRRDGTISKSWLLLGMNGEQPFYQGRITVGDFNKDGITDIAVVSDLIQGGQTGGLLAEGVLTVLTTGSPVDPNGDDWPTIYLNAQNTAALRRVAKSTLSVASSATPSVFGQPVTISAAVASAAANSNTPTGSFNLYEGSTLLGSCVLVSGSCSVQLAALSTGTHKLSASYAGDSKFDIVSSTLSQTVSQASTSLSLTSSSNPVVAGQVLTLKVTLSVVAPGAGVPTGVATFYDGSSSIGTVTLDATGQALLTTTLSQGTHAISVAYGGDSSFLNSQSDVTSETVNAADFLLSATSSPVVHAGSSAGYTISVTPNPVPYNFEVTGFTCSGLPQASSCLFGPSSVTPGTNPGSVNLSISTTARTAAAMRPDVPPQSPVLATWFALSLIGLVGTVQLVRQEKVPVRPTLILLALTVVSGLWISCGGGSSGSSAVSGTPAGTYIITVTAIGNGVTRHTVNISMQVN
jgi:subtilisin family serine protease